jgi:anti-sigma B factor antagonist
MEPVGISSVEPGCSRQLEVRDEISCGQHRLVLAGELDLASVPEFGEVVERICADSTRAITVDLSQLSFMDSSGLHAMLTLREHCRERGYELQIIPGQPQVQRLFELTGLIDVLPFAA